MREGGLESGDSSRTLTVNKEINGQIGGGMIESRIWRKEKRGGKGKKRFFFTGYELNMISR